MKWGYVSLHVPVGPQAEMALALFALIMFCFNVGLVVAMRYERRVR